MKKIILISFFVLFFGFLFGQKVSAVCILEDINSSCTELDAKAGITIRKSFVEDVVNKGFNFSLRGFVTLNNNSFIIENTDKIYFISNAPEIDSELALKITRQGLTEISFSANKLIRYKYIFIDKSSPLSIFTNPVNNITLNTPDGVIKGGDIVNEPPWTKLGSGGNIIFKGKIVQVGNISVRGFSGQGGDVTIFGDYIIVGVIAVNSIRGTLPVEDTQRAFGRAGAITIKGDGGVDQVIGIKTGDLFAYGVSPSDIDISAKELIWVEGEIMNTSGCNLETKVPRQDKSGCDYGTLCDVYPDKYPKRRYCERYNTSGKVVLRADGIARSDTKDRGIFIGGIINNSAASNLPNLEYNTYDNTNIGEAELYTGAGQVGQISIKAPKGLVFINAIISVGFHITDINNPRAIDIEGEWVQLTGENGFRIGVGNLDKTSIVADNFDVHIKPDDAGAIAANLNDPGGGRIRILAKGEDSEIILGQGISSRGRYAYWPNGGEVEIRSDYRIEGDGGANGDVLSIDVSGREGIMIPVGGMPDWYIVKGASKAPGVNPVYIGSIDEFCGLGSNEYFNGIDGGDALTGGNGGRIDISADIIQWHKPAAGNKSFLSLTTNGGRGSDGAYGGVGAYCNIDNNNDGIPTSFTGPISAVAPRVGRGGKGGDGGNGGIINVSADNLHCFDNLSVSSVGGEGGRTGDENFREFGLSGNFSNLDYESYNDHIGNCNLTGWEGKFVYKEWPPDQAGKGGNGGQIILSPMPTDNPVTSASLYAYGSKAGSHTNLDKNIPYPWYCTETRQGFPTPCQSALFDVSTKSGYDYEVDRNADILKAEQLGQAFGQSYKGETGANGGNGGDIRTDTLISVPVDYNVAGGDATGGSDGQNTFVNNSGDGGNGGNGGNAGLVEVPDEILANFPNELLRYQGGKAGIHGLAGKSIINLPKSEEYFNLNGNCKKDGDERFGGNNYSVNVWSVKTIPDAQNGIDGQNGLPRAPMNSGAGIAMPGGEKRCLVGGERNGPTIDWRIWQNNEILKNLRFVDDFDLNGFPGGVYPDDASEEINNKQEVIDFDFDKKIIDKDGPDVCFDEETCPDPRCIETPDNICVLIPGPWINGYPPEPNNPPSISSFSFLDDVVCFRPNPIIIFNWEFSDEGDTQSAFQIQVSEDEVFKNIVLDSCVPAPGTCEPGHNSKSYTPPLGSELGYKKTYYWRLMVWDSKGLASEDWKNGVIYFIIPGPNPRFSWTPMEPDENEPVIFNNTTDISSDCLDGPCVFSWTFEDGFWSDDNSPSDDDEAADYYPGFEPNNAIYFILGNPADYNKTVTLKATDKTGLSCEIPKIVNLKGALKPPKWIEIPP